MFTVFRTAAGWCKKIDRRSAAVALAMGLGLTFAAAVQGWSYSEEVGQGIAAQVIRFHVRANSDSEDDQSLKMLVKEGVLDHFRQPLTAAENIGETRAFLTQNLAEIEAVAAGIVSEAGYDFPVAAAMVTEYFPTRVYGDVRLPAGRYEALRIDIGGAVGGNWWCVMFPPLCYVDVSVREIPQREMEILRDVLTDEEFLLVTGDLQVEFKVIELWQRVREESGLYFALN